MPARLASADACALFLKSRDRSCRRCTTNPAWSGRRCVCPLYLTPICDTHGRSWGNPVRKPGNCHKSCEWCLSIRLCRRPARMARSPAVRRQHRSGMFT